MTNDPNSTSSNPIDNWWKTGEEVVNTVTTDIAIAENEIVTESQSLLAKLDRWFGKLFS